MSLWYRHGPVLAGMSVLALTLFAFTAATAAEQQVTTVDPVENMQRILSTTVTDPLLRRQLLQQEFPKIRRINHFSQILRLGEWRDGDLQSIGSDAVFQVYDRKVADKRDTSPPMRLFSELEKKLAMEMPRQLSEAFRKEVDKNLKGDARQRQSFWSWLDGRLKEESSRLEPEARRQREELIKKTIQGIAQIGRADRKSAVLDFDRELVDFAGAAYDDRAKQLVERLEAIDTAAAKTVAEEFLKELSKLDAARRKKLLGQFEEQLAAINPAYDKGLLGQFDRELDTQDRAQKQAIGQDMQTELAGVFREARTEWIRQYDSNISKIDAVFRKAIGQRFENALIDLWKKNDPAEREAALVMIGEIGVSIRNTDPEQRGEFTSQLAPLLVRVMESNAVPPRQRALASRSLGKINPEPKMAVKALADMFVEAPEIRRAAAEGLTNMIRTLLNQQTPQLTADLKKQSVDVLPLLVEIAPLVIPELGKHVNDPDRQVQRHCLEGIQLMTRHLSEMIPVPRRDTDDASDGRDSTPDYLLLKSQQYLPIAVVISHQIVPVTRALRSPDVTSRDLAARIFDDLSYVRLTYDSWDLMNDGNRSPRPLLDGLREAIPELMKQTNDPDRRVRLAVLNAIESMGKYAEPAMPALARATRDEYVFVRWVAARAISRIAPAQPEIAVPALAGLMQDEDIEVRTHALRALERYGEKARSAGPAVARAVLRGDVEVRLLAIETLLELGADVQVVLPTLIQVSSHPDPKVRREAIKGIAHIGSDAVPAIPRLRQLLADPDAEVRKLAGEAIISIDDD